MAESVVNIRVTRNENSPVFLQTPYRVTINETIALGTCILTVSARDDDGVRVFRIQLKLCFGLPLIIIHYERKRCLKLLMSFIAYRKGYVQVV